MRIDAMLCPTNAATRSVVPKGLCEPAMEPACPPFVNAAQFQSAERCGATKNCALAQGRIFVRVLPGDRQLPKEKDQEGRRDSKSESKSGSKNGLKHGPKDAVKNGAHREPQPSPHRETGSPMPDSAAELPPLIRRQEVVAIALVGLLVIAVTTV